MDASRVAPVMETLTFEQQKRVEHVARMVHRTDCKCEKPWWAMPTEEKVHFLGVAMESIVAAGNRLSVEEMVRALR